MKRVFRWAFVALVVCACGGSARPAGDVGDDANLPVISLVARRWSYEPPSITLKVGVPAILEITSADVHHGFNLPDFGVRADAIPGKKSRVKVVPDKTGTFEFHCDYYCGSGHEGMEGQIVVE
ncbi:MAG TPA: cupredoxin domain-containing protein [Polyangiaceae bacterium]|nr:cupredoxin domain-containing protein [Polyangiaceae bacterium]